METVYVFNANESFNKDGWFKLALDSDQNIQLDIQSLDELKGCIDDIAKFAGDKCHLIKSIRGPIITSDGKSLFEDTVSSVSLVEDILETEVDSITTFKVDHSSHIDELCDFYGMDVRINIDREPCFCPDMHKGQDPFSMALWCQHKRDISCCLDLRTVLDTDVLPPGWLSGDIVHPLLNYIGEVRFTLRKDMPRGVQDLYMSFFTRFTDADYRIALKYQ